ncbi:uncharacterized protein [Penaeus vannamei]|uniref:uncharacterized protein n=1 Tax=Penaeus vannamei TaxID=6689 RepID=UPI00387F86EA
MAEAALWIYPTCILIDCWLVNLCNIKSCVIKNCAILSFTFSTYYSYQQEILDDGISKADFKLLVDLSKSPDLVVTKPDKDQGVVLMNKVDYINKVNVILEDKSTFAEVNIHKPDVLIRPILSALSTINYKVSKFFTPLLKNLTINQYTISNTHFCSKLMIEGVAMGSPLGPTLANIFMCHNEEIWLRDCPSDFKPVHYYRYVDDTLLLFKSRDHIDKFLEYLNKKHPNI